jgi:hypothetical protein
MSPWSLAPAEDEDVDKGHDCHAADLYDLEREDGMLCPVVEVIHAIHDERDDPKYHVDAWVDEEEA